MKPKISVLVSARKNSKYLAKFLFGYFYNTARSEDLEILVCKNAGDTWNKELSEYFGSRVKFVIEDMGLGRAGLHEYFRLLADRATGDWLIYFCEDHFITYPQVGLEGRPCWDKYVLSEIDRLQLDPKKVYCLVPKFDNAGAMNHIISRGYYEAMGAKLAQHGNLDSYINDVNKAVWGDSAVNRPNNRPTDRVIRLDHETFHDFTHDHPSPMDDAHMQAVITERGKQMPKYTDPQVAEWILEDAQKIKQAIEKGL